MEAVSFDDTLREMERIVTSSLNESKIIPVNSIDMYTTTEELGRLIEEERIVKVHTKDKTVDEKVRHVVASLPYDDLWWMKRVAADPSLRDL